MSQNNQTAVLTPELVRGAFQDAMPERRDAFRESVAEARRKKDHRYDMKQWYPAEVLRLSKQEAIVRLDMAASQIENLLDSGWRPGDGHDVESAFVQLFGQYRTMRNEPSGDLPAAVETAVREVAGLNPPDQPSDTRAKDLVAKFYEFWTEATRARISALKCYVPKGAPNRSLQTAPEVVQNVRPHSDLKRVFLGYPFVLNYVRPAVERAAHQQAQVIVASDVLRGQPLLHKIESMMKDADLCLFDLTLHNPNVAAEFGIAHAKGYKYAVLYCVDEKLNPTPGRESSLFSDVKGWDALLYATPEELEVKLRYYLPDLLASQVPGAPAPLAVESREERDRAFAVQPIMHIVLGSGEGSPQGSFLNGFIRNVGRGIAREPKLFLPGFGRVAMSDHVVKPLETVKLRLQYDDQPFYIAQLGDASARIEFEDELGNRYEQRGVVEQRKGEHSEVFSYGISTLDRPRLIAKAPGT
jgi:hypothetical protein